MNELTKTSRIKGALYGAAVGDALGVTYEFIPAAKMPQPPYEMLGGGPFKFAPGFGSDDTDLLLCALNAYPEEAGFFDRKIMMANLIDWLEGDPPDVGNQTRYAIQQLKLRGTVPDDEYAQGNGGLMRAAAHALMSDQDSKAYNNAYDDTRLTHPSRETAHCSGVYARTLWKLLEGEEAGDVLEECYYAPYTLLTPDDGGHCMHSLRLALWALWHHGEGFENILSMVIASGGDTDTNATIAGGLLGAANGFEDIPLRWLEKLNTDKLDEQLGRILEKDDAGI